VRLTNYGSRMSIHKWLTWYRTGGLDELTRRTRGGNRATPRSRLTPDQQAQLLQTPLRKAFPRGSRVVSRDTGRGAVRDRLGVIIRRAMNLSGLYVITDPSLRDPIETARAVLEAGVRDWYKIPYP
jgi:hypothetical protein